MNATPQEIYSSYLRGEFDNPTTVRLLLTLTTESNKHETRKESLELLGNMDLKGNKSAFTALEILLLSDEDEIVRTISARILISNFSNRAIKPIKWALRHETSIECGIEIIKMFSDINTKETRKVLVRELLDLSYRREQSNQVQKIIGIFKESLENTLQGKDINELDLKNIAQILINFKTMVLFTKKLRYAPIELDDSNVIAIDLKNKNIREYGQIKLLENLRMLRTLSMNNNFLVSLPDTFGNLTNLKVLNLSLNQLSTLPESIGNLIELKTLDVSNNDLRILPDTIGKLASLQRLDLSNNHMIRTLPESIGKLRSLKLLDLSNNRIESLPDPISSLTSLEYLDLSGNQITHLPESIDKLLSLKVLNLENNLLKVLPESIGRLPSIQTLNLGGNHLKSLPDTIGDLTTLQKLDLHNNELKTFPNSISKLASLHLLEAYYNEIEVIPQSIENMVALQYLDLRHNQLKSFPKCIEALPALRTLLVRGNRLSPKYKLESVDILKRLVEKGVGIFE